MELKTLIGLRIKELRKKSGVSQEKLAERSEISVNHLSNIEQGKENPTLDTFLRISSALDVKLHDLFDFDHHQDRKELRKIIISAANNAPVEELQFIVKLINTLEK